MAACQKKKKNRRVAEGSGDPRTKTTMGTMDGLEFSRYGKGCPDPSLNLVRRNTMRC